MLGLGLGPTGLGLEPSRLGLGLGLGPTGLGLGLSGLDYITVIIITAIAECLVVNNVVRLHYLRSEDQVPPSVLYSNGL